MKQLLNLALVLLLVSCVKDASDISPNTLFDVKVDGVNIAKAVIMADNTLKYKVELEAMNGVDIDDDKNVSVSVSEGSLSPISNLSPTAASTQISVPVQGGKGTFYYVPGRKPQKLAILSMTLQGISQVFNFDVLPLEPTQIQLTVRPSQPKVTDDLEVTAYLINSSPGGASVSDNLKVSFEASKATSPDTIEGYVAPPAYASSTLSTQTGLVASKISVSTNRKPGKLLVKATYTKLDGTSIQDAKTVQFIP